jgi:hypothetical protein
MSYILVTFGYNQFNLFNIKASTPTLIDKIKEVSFQNIVQRCLERDKQLAKEIEASLLEEDKIQKQIAATEQDLQIEKEKYDLAVKQLEAKRKKEEMEQKKKEEEEKKGKKKKDDKKKAETKKKNDPKKKQEENEGVSDQAINDLKDKIEKLNTSLNTITNNKNIYNDKKTKLQVLINTYRKKYKDRVNIRIDLADAKGEKVNIIDKFDLYANDYLVEKTVYELHSFNEVVKDEEKDSKKNTKKDFKKDKKAEEKKEKEKDKEKDKDAKEEKKIEYVLEPVKIDGYCFRSIQEDEELDENEKGGKDKKGKKK